MHAPRRLAERVNAFVWERPDAGRPRWQDMLADQARLAVCIGRDFLSGELSLRAMGLVFTSLLSLVPLIAVSFSVLTGLGVHNRIEPLLNRAFAPLGERSDEVVDRIVGFVDGIQVGVLGTVGTVFLVVVAVSLVQKVEEAFNFTWNIERPRRLVRRISDYLTIILVGPLLVFGAMGITASLSSTAFMRHLREVEPFGSLLHVAGILTPYALVIVAFTFLYLVIPNTRVKLGPALFGGAVAGILWESVGRLFTNFVVTSTSYAAIYSGFAILLLFMIWLNLSWLILLIGSAIAFYRQHPGYRAVGGRYRARLAPAQRERLGVALMLAIVSDWQAGRPPARTEELAERMGVPVHPVERMLTTLLAAGLITPGGQQTSGYLPGGPPDSMRVKRVLDAVRHHAEHRRLLPERDAADQWVTEEVDRALEQATGSLTMADLVAREDDGERASGA